MDHQEKIIELEKRIQNLEMAYVALRGDMQLALIEFQKNTLTAMADQMLAKLKPECFRDFQ